jgi:hypothetical protein
LLPRGQSSTEISQPARTSAAAQRLPDELTPNAASPIKQTAFDGKDQDNDANVVAPPSVPSSAVPELPTESVQNVVSAETPSPPDGTYPLDLTTSLLLTSGQNTQVAFAQARIAESQAQADRAAALWLPSLRAGVNYNKHEGQIQDVAGNVFSTSRGALYTGLGANAVGAGSPSVPGVVANFHLTDAIFQPKAARNAANAREWEARAITNNELHQTAVAYLELLRAGQELAIARDTHQRVENLARLTQAYAKTGQGLESDYDRARTELSLRVNEMQRAEEQIRVVSVRLAERLRLDPLLNLQPQ